MRIIRNDSIGIRLGSAIALCVLLCSATTQSYAAENLDCPEIGPGHVPDLIRDVRGGGLVITENFIDLANEVNDAISRLVISSPDISRDNVQDVLIAAYCRVVAHEPALSASEKWSRMRQFTGVVEREIAAEWRTAGKLIIARVPLPPDVYRGLQAQAEISHLTAAQLAADILARAAGK
jgi:hypothetical protein